MKTAASLQYSITVLEDSQHPYFLIDVMDTPMRAASVAKLRLDEWTEYCSECNNQDASANRCTNLFT